MEEEQKGATNWSPLARIFLFLILAALTFLFNAALGMAIVWAWLYLQHDLSPEFSQIQTSHQFFFSLAAISASYPPLALLTIAFMRRTNQISLGEFGLVSKYWLRDFWFGILLGSAFVLLMFWIYSITGLVRFEPVSKISWKHWLVMSLWLCPLIGFTEELVFRGYLLSLAEKWRGRIFAVVFTGVLFWLVHWGQGNTHEFLGAAGIFTLSTTFALAKYLTGNIWLPAGLHAGYNWMAISFGGEIGLGFPALMEFSTNVPKWLVGPPGYVGVLDLAFYWLLFLSVALISPKLAERIPNQLKEKESKGGERSGKCSSGDFGRSNDSPNTY